MIVIKEKSPIPVCMCVHAYVRVCLSECVCVSVCVGGGGGQAVWDLVISYFYLDSKGPTRSSGLCCNTFCESGRALASLLTESLATAEDTRTGPWDMEEDKAL